MTVERVERRLAAILAVDVVGYSRLVSVDEADALARLGAMRRDIIEPTIASHSGRLFKIMGDGFLAEFASAVQAVSCALAIQAETEAVASGFDAAQKMQLRIGIHVGDVMVEGPDLMGDGINIAARLESIAATGGISISRAVHDQVRDRIKIKFDDNGEVALKNIARPVQVFSVTRAKTAPAVQQLPSPLALPDKASIAVLPFKNMSGDPEQEYFADGMVEDITTALSRNSWLFVIARNSSFTYKGKTIDIKQVGTDLGVRYVLEGSVRKTGSRVRITGQLIDASTNAHIWADRFDGSIEDVFDLQDKITSSVIGAIAPKIEFAEIERSKRKLENLQAYDYYLRGLSGLYRFTREGNQEAKNFFEKALCLDPNFAMAYTGIAAWYIASKAYLWSEHSERDVSSIEELTRRFLASGNDNARVLAHAGQVLSFVIGNIEEGQFLLHQAIILDPNFATARLWLGNASLYLGELDISRENYESALRLSPRDPRIFLAQVGLANVCFLSGEFEEASKWAILVVRQSPTFPPGPRLQMLCHAIMGQIDDARRAREMALQLDPNLSIANFRSRSPFRRPEHVMKFEEAYRLAGIPE